jgi:hypothetical protein
VGSIKSDHIGAQGRDKPFSWSCAQCVPCGTNTSGVNREFNDVYTTTQNFEEEQVQSMLFAGDVLCMYYKHNYSLKVDLVIVRSEGKTKVHKARECNIPNQLSAKHSA